MTTVSWLPPPSQVIIEAEDEYRRRGHWTRLFPCVGMRSYLPFFEFPRLGIGLGLGLGLRLGLELGLGLGLGLALGLGFRVWSCRTYSPRYA